MNADLYIHDEHVLRIRFALTCAGETHVNCKVIHALSAVEMGHRFSFRRT